MSWRLQVDQPFLSWVGFFRRRQVAPFETERAQEALRSKPTRDLPSLTLKAGKGHVVFAVVGKFLFKLFLGVAQN